MTDQRALIGGLFEKSQNLAKKSVELYKLKALDTSADIISTLAAQLTVLVFIAVFFLFANIGIALWIGEAIGNSYIGFFIVAGSYVIISLISYLLANKWIKAPLQNSIITQALK
jgi:hypothetical protein